MLVPFPPWRPDTPDVGADGTVALGVFPDDRNGDGVAYGPFPQFNLLVTTALTAMCQGAQSFLDADGDTHIFAGDATKLYKLNGASWDDVSDVGGYTIASDAVWKFPQLRTSTQDIIFALGDVNTDIQYFDLNSSTDFAQLSSDAPRAKCGAVVDGNILMVGNTWDATGGYCQTRVWWHGRNSLTGVPLPTSWPTPGGSTAQEQQSDYRDLDTNGPITAIVGPVGGAVAGLVFARKSIHRVVKAATIGYEFYKISGELGCSAGNSVIVVDDKVLFLSDKGWYVTDGQSTVRIGASKIDDWFFNLVDETKLYRVFGANVPRLKIALFAFASTSGGGACDYLIAFNYEIGEWSLIASDLTLELIFNSLSTGLTLEDLDAIYATLEDIPFSLDSPVFQGGRPFVGAFSNAHKYGAFSGENLAARVETGDLMQAGNRRFRSTGVRPIIEASGTLASGDVTVAIGYRDVPNGSVTYDTATAIADNGLAPQLRSAKFQRARINVAAGVDWKHMVGAEYEFVQEGRF